MKKAKFENNRFLIGTTLGLIGTAAFAPSTYASGFGLREGAADWLGNAFVGGSAKAYDAATSYTNPAGMALLNQSQVSGNVSFIAPSAKFSGSNTVNTPLGGTTSGSTGNAVAPATSGALFGVLVLNPEWRVGLSVTNPYGERTSYGKNWVGRYNSLVSSITGVDFSTALSYKVNNHLSIGGGPVVEYFYSRLTQAVDSYVLSQSAMPSDGLADVHGSDVALGYNIGALYQIDAYTRVGLDYRSRIRHNIHGTEAVQNIPSSSGALSYSTAARTTATVPDSVNFSIYQQVTPDLALIGTVEWIHWNLFNTLNVTPATGAGTTIQENWRNTWFAGIGANYQAAERLMLQTGFSFDESPVTNSNRTSRVPDANHYNLGLGMKYKLLPSTTLNVAYLHVFTLGGTINSTAPLATGVTNNLNGTYSASDNSVTFGINYVF